MIAVERLAQMSAIGEVAGSGRGAGHMRDVIAGGTMMGSRPKLWIVSALSAAAGLATSLIGGAKASQAAKRAERRQREREAEENADYLRRRNEDYVDTAAGQNLVRRAKDYAQQQWKKAAGAQAVAGGTDAAAQQAKDAGNKMVGDTIADIAATDVQRKAAADATHQQARSQFAQMDMQREQQRAQNITDAAGAASNAIMTAAGAVEQASAGNTSLVGGNNGGTPKSPFDGVTGLGDAIKESDEWAREHGVS
ncbi:MAG: hypothetical protein IJ588_03780 [Prevotella sp.]|nr:hypothetical protein [Prevotella sp.]